MVKNLYGIEINFAVAVELMDDGIRESLHAKGIDNEQEFFDAYCAEHEKKFHEAFELAKRNPVY